jgi:hypothetical protein
MHTELHDIEKLPALYRDILSGEATDLPVYRILGIVFLSLPGGPPSLHEAGAEICCPMDFVPNDKMLPLNRSAGVVWNGWRKSLPPPGLAMTAEDLRSAAYIIAKKYAGQEPPPSEDWYAELHQIAVELRNAREGRRLHEVSTPAIRSGKVAAPMTNLSDYKEGYAGQPNMPGQSGQRPAGPQVRRMKSAPLAPHPAAGDTP